MKKLLCVLLCLLLAIAVLAGCTTPGNQTEDPNKETKDPSVSSEGVHYDADGNLVVPRHDGVTLTIGIPKNSYVLDYKDNYYTRWLEEKTGINLEFREYGYAAADYQKQLSTETAVPGQLPDILWNFGLGDDLLTKYGDDGYFLDISDLIEDTGRAAILHEKLEEMRNDTNGDWSGTADRVWKAMYADDSENADGEDYPIYGVPKINTSLVDNLDFIPYINTNWLKAVNMEAPKTIAELEAVLRAFRDIDCNGNGKTEEQIPMIGSGPDVLAGDTLAWLINLYVYCQNETMFNIDAQGNLYLPQTTDKYREALEWINMLIDEKLLHTNTLTYKSSSVKNVLSNGDNVGIVVGQPSLIFASSTDSIYRFEVLNLFNYTYYNQDGVQVRNFITDSCDDVDAAFDLLMLMSTWDSAVIQRYGEEGVNWERTDGTTMTSMGIPANIKIITDDWNTPQSQHWNTCNGFNTYDTFDLIDTSGDSDPWSQKKWEHFGNVTAYYKAAYENTKQELGEAALLPYLRLNAEEQEIAKNRGDVKNVVSTWTLNFINGSKEINDANWNQYLQELKTAGLQQWIDAAQMCYDRMYPNGHVSN